MGPCPDWHRPAGWIIADPVTPGAIDMKLPMPYPGGIAELPSEDQGPRFTRPRLRAALARRPRLVQSVGPMASLEQCGREGLPPCNQVDRPRHSLGPAPNGSSRPGKTETWRLMDGSTPVARQPQGRLASSCSPVRPTEARGLSCPRGHPGRHAKREGALERDVFL